MSARTKKDLYKVKFNFKAESGWMLPEPGKETVIGMGTWLRQAIQLVPLQLCRVEYGEMRCMSDGQNLRQEADVAGMEAIASTISFGLYDSIFESAEVPVVVVSSMGAQVLSKAMPCPAGLSSCIWQNSNH